MVNLYHRKKAVRIIVNPALTIGKNLNLSVLKIIISVNIQIKRVAMSLHKKRRVMGGMEVFINPNL